MKWNNKFIYPKSSRSTEDGLRKYLIDGEKLPSVTSVIDFTKSNEDKAAISNWRERTGIELANKIQKDAAKRGGKMHAFIEQYLLGQLNQSLFEKNEQFQKMAETIIKQGIDGRLQEIWGVEATLTFPQKYGGTADLLGIFDQKESVIDFKNSLKLKTMDLNLSAPFFMAQAVVEEMKKRKWGRIINYASLASRRALPSSIAYGASKGGVEQLTRAMAEAWSPFGINVNAIAPGFFPTELTVPVFNDSERTIRNAKQTCIGRNGELQDLNGPLLFLCSKSSDYVTGQLIFVDGGFTAK